MPKFVLDSYALDAKKSEAKAKIADAIGSNASISGNEITVPSYAAEKVTQILGQVAIRYSGGWTKNEIFNLLEF